MWTFALIMIGLVGVFYAYIALYVVRILIKEERLRQEEVRRRLLTVDPSKTCEATPLCREPRRRVMIRLGSRTPFQFCEAHALEAACSPLWEEYQG